MSEWMKYLLPSLFGLGTSVCAAYFSARWAVRRAFQERWWEKKHQAYTEILVSLHVLARYYQRASDAAEAGRELTPEENVGVDQAHRTVAQAIELGSFLISPEAAQVLVHLRNSPELDPNDNPWFDIYFGWARNYRIAFKRIREHAKHDLNKLSRGK